MKDIKVSVCMITYGHEAFIEEAINGVLMQQCNFEVELIVSNDCSPDATDQVIKKIVESHPNASWIRYIKHEKNIGMMPNFIYTLKQAKGKYIALCDGDDYWTDPLKLQKQVDFLEKNQEYSGSSHFVSVLAKDRIVKLKFKEIEFKSKWEITDLKKIEGTLLSQTSSYVFRSVAFNLKDFEYYSSKIYHGDTFIFTYLWKYGPIHFINENMSVYRIHGNGISNLLLGKDSNFYRDRVIENNIYIKLYPFLKYKFENAKYFNLIYYALTIKIENRNKKRANFLLRKIVLKGNVLHLVITKKSYRRPVFRLLFAVLRNWLLYYKKNVFSYIYK